MTIEPPGGDPRAIAVYADYLVREAYRDPQRTLWANDAGRAMDLYYGNHWETTAAPEVIRLVVNRIQNAIISIMAMQAADPPSVRFVPRETGDDPLVYLNTRLPEAVPFVNTIAAQGGDPSQPLPGDLAEQIQQQIDASEAIAAQMQAMGQPAPKPLPAELLERVTDQTAAEALQTIVEAGWEQADGPYYFSENILNKNVVGWQPTLYEFDDATKQHCLTNVHPLQMFVDPLLTDQSRWAYAIYDQPMGADEAKAKWPHLAKQIDDVKQQGYLRWPGSRMYAPAQIYQGNQWSRDMIVKRTLWLRWQPYPMDEKQAVDAGAVEVRDVPDGVDQIGPDGMPMPAPMRQGYFLAGTDTEVRPGEPSWPMRTGIRQCVIVADECVDDRECEHCDIPLPTNKNIPVPFSNFAQGEPKRLEGLQMAINRVLSSIVTHHAYNAYPPEYMAEGIAQQMDKAMKGARTQPGQRIRVPEALLQQVQYDVKKLLMLGDVPALPADAWQLIKLLLDLIDREGNQADVMQGNASASWSGEAIKTLQNAASMVIRGKSLFTEFYLKRIFRLMAHSVINRMTPMDWAKYLGSKPPAAIQALHDRAKSLDVDISVTISSGGAASKQSETNNLIAARQAGILISEPELLERLGIDPDADQQRQVAYLQRQQKLAGAAAQPAPAQQQVNAQPQAAPSPQGQVNAAGM